ncbi:FprA family A-type flavoprotein [bacterium]|nr:FprA family A-type flavoprotein [bacterium]
MDNRYIAEVKNGIYWVGSVDWNLRDFHGFTTPRGASYNAFLIKGSEPILVDTVKRPFTGELLAKAAAVTDLKNIRHLIINHIEPDHSGAFPEVIRHLPNCRIYASEIGKIGLHRYYDFERDIQVVRSGETLALGDRTVRFVETPMAHWPDSMVTWMPDEKVLFSSDIFGQFLATSERFDDESDPPFLDAAVYYANIVFPFNREVIATLDLVKQLKLNPEYVLPDHGILWKKHIAGIMDRYRSWATGACAEGVLILYDTMWGSTEIMAGSIHDSLVRRGVTVRKLRIRSSSLSDIMREVLFSRVVLIGTPTINNTVFPAVGQVLIYMQGLDPGPGRLWGAFGSYGWGGGGVEYVSRWLRQNRYEVIHAPVESQFTPNKALLAACDEYAEAVAGKIANMKQ